LNVFVQAIEVVLNGFPAEDHESAMVKQLNALLHDEEYEQVPVHIEVRTRHS
jgi:hypothetical protein